VCECGVGTYTVIGLLFKGTIDYNIRANKKGILPTGRRRRILRLNPNEMCFTPRCLPSRCDLVLLNIVILLCNIIVAHNNNTKRCAGVMRVCQPAEITIVDVLYTVHEITNIRSMHLDRIL